MLFEDIHSYIKSKQLIFVVDEIQWIAKNKAGFIGAIKNKWIDFEKSGNMRLVICGSSNKFFHNYTGGEEQILRGLKTRSDIWVKPVDLKILKNSYFRKWKLEEILLIYMFVGGVPYYLNQIDRDKNFYTSINEILFEPQSLFIEEVDEVLKLEFNKAGIITIKKILNSLGMRGRCFSDIQKRTKISNSTLSEAIEKLIEYNIIEEVKPAFANSKENSSGTKYLMRDFYLNTYFNLIKPNLAKINRNSDKNLIINSIFHWPRAFYYIENFTGEAFENFIIFLLRESVERKEPLFQKLGLRNINFDVGTHWDKERQLDIVIYNCQDMQNRILECKWTSSIQIITDAILQLRKKASDMKDLENSLLGVVIPIMPSKALERIANENHVVLISQSDFL